jgi:hypothetical protein
MTQLEDDKCKYDVNQIDNAIGVPLTCTNHPLQHWCPCRSMVVNEGIDGPSLWHWMLVTSGIAFEVHVNITKDTVIRLSLVTDEWHLDPDSLRLEVHLRGAEFADREPFKSERHLTALGCLNYGEGRAVLRELIINRFASIFVMQEQECRSKYHGPKEHMDYLKSRTYPARAWDWDYLTWYEEGVCPVCHARQERILNAALETNSEELERKTEVNKPIPWEPTSVVGLADNQKKTGRILNYRG